jgi:hypothetical protein
MPVRRNRLVALEFVVGPRLLALGDGSNRHHARCRVMGNNCCLSALMAIYRAGGD